METQSVSIRESLKALYKPRVFIVEDDLDSIHIMERIILSINHEAEISWVSSAEEALFRLKQHKKSKWHNPYDLIICDIFLKGEDTGIDFYLKFKDIYPQIPFIATSGTQIARYLDVEGIDIPIFLQKPIQASEWRYILSEFIA